MNKLRVMFLVGFLLLAYLVFSDLHSQAGAYQQETPTPIGTMPPRWLEETPEQAYDNPVCATQTCNENLFIDYKGTPFAVTPISGFIQGGTWVAEDVPPLFTVTINYRGKDWLGNVKLLNIRQDPSANNLMIGNLAPCRLTNKTLCPQWAISEVIPVGNDRWGRLQSQPGYIPLKYIGVYYTSWHE